MDKIKIGLVEIGDSFGGQYYLPYSVGILRAYAEKHIVDLSAYEFLPFIYKNSGIGKLSEELLAADIIFYSTYLWNFRKNLEIAECVAAHNPAVVNVFGGPQIPNQSNKLVAFLRQYPFIKIAAFGEGESCFLKIIEAFSNSAWHEIPSICFRGDNGDVNVNEFREVIRDIDEIPSPYLSGVFDDLIEKHPGEKWQARLETNRGCPFTCAFCYWGERSERKIKRFDLNRIFGEIDWISRHRIEFVFCCDANFGILNRDLDIAKKVSRNKERYGYPKAFSVQNTKNSKRKIFDIQKILNDNGLQKGVNLALQSMNMPTLEIINRSNIDNSAYTELQQLFTKSLIPTFTDLIIGLPGETYQSFTSGVSGIIERGQHNRIQFINLTALENTPLAEPVFQKEHGLKITDTQFIPHHSSLNGRDEIVEVQQLVTATKTMPEKEWARARVFSWMVSLLYFNKCLQIPFMIMHALYDIAYSDIVEAFMKENTGQRVISDIVASLKIKAENIQRGESEYSTENEWLNIAWHLDELILIKICAEGQLDMFYTEAAIRLKEIVKEHDESIDQRVITEAVRLNRELLKQPFIHNDLRIKCDFNIWEIYRSGLIGEKHELREGDFEYEISRGDHRWGSWEDWCREVIWYGYKRGDYLYPVKSMT